MGIDKMLDLAPKTSCTVIHTAHQYPRGQLDFNTHGNIRSKDGEACVSLSVKEFCGTKFPSANA